MNMKCTFKGFPTELEAQKRERRFCGALLLLSEKNM